MVKKEAGYAATQVSSNVKTARNHTHKKKYRVTDYMDRVRMDGGTESRAQG